VKRVAAVGAVVGLVVVVALGGLGGSPREVAGMLLVGLSAGAGCGVGGWFRYAWGPDRPESKARFLRLMAFVAVTSMGGIVLGAFLAGITGR
jgi:hypothetical protein